MSTARVIDWPAPASLEHPVEMEFTNCPQCGGSDSQTVVVAADSRTRLGGRFRVVRCRDCGLHFTNPRPTARSIGRFYSELPNVLRLSDSHQRDTERRASQQSHDAQSRATMRERWEALRRTCEQAVLQTDYGYPPHAPGGLGDRLLAAAGRALIRRSWQRRTWFPFRGSGRLLDFGCGDGAFLLRMRELGWTVQGLDASAASARMITFRTGIPVQVGVLAHAPLPPCSFDAITMWSSLQQTYQPRETLRRAHAALRPGGLAVIGVANIGSWSFKKFQHEWQLLDLPRHLVHFTAETLRELLRREGFGVLSLKHVGRPGVIRRSAVTAAASGWGPLWLRTLRNSRLATLLAHRTERRKQADYLCVVAEKI